MTTDTLPTIAQRLSGHIEKTGWVPSTVLKSLLENSPSSLLHAVRRTKRLTDEQIAEAFAAIGIPPADLSRVEPEAVSIIDGDIFDDFFARNKALPYQLGAGTVTVAVDDPTNEAVLAELRRLIDARLVITYARKEQQDLGLSNAIALFHLNQAFEDTRPHFPDVPDDIWAMAQNRASPSDTVAHALLRTGTVNEPEAFTALAASYGASFQGFLSNRFDPEALSESRARALNTIVLHRDAQHAQIITDHPEKSGEVQDILAVPVHVIVTTPQIMDASYDEAYASARRTVPPASLTQALIRMGKLPSSEADNDKAPEEALAAGRINEEDLARALALYRNLEYINPEERPSNPQVMGMVPEHILKDNRAWPHSINEDGALVILVADPRHKSTINAITRNVRGTVVFAVSTPTSITRLLHGKITKQQNIDQLTKEVGARTAARNADTGTADDDNSTLRVIHGIIKDATLDRASDIHLEQRADGLHVRLRVDGEMRTTTVMPAANASSIITAIKTLARLRIEEKYAPQSGRIAYTRDDLDLNLRVETSRIALGNEGGEKVVMRLLRKTANLGALESLLFHPSNIQAFRRVIQRPYGIVLFTGPTGSGKTTTIFTALKEVSTPNKNTLTIEDPVEITLPGISQHEVNPQRNVTMSNMLKSFLRQDPDIILVGEIRDTETAKIAIEAALTGHLVIASLHTNTAVGAITRLREMGVEDFNISAAVLGVMGQRLVQRLCVHCREPYTPSAEERAELGMDPNEDATLYRPHPDGCIKCHRKGFTDRVALHEFLTVTPAVKRGIVERLPDRELTRIATSDPTSPLRLMREDGLWKVTQGYTTREKVHAATSEE